MNVRRRCTNQSNGNKDKEKTAENKEQQVRVTVNKCQEKFS